MAAKKAPARIAGAVMSVEEIELATERADRARAEATRVKQQKRTAPRKTTHHVDNDDVHTDNESARQVDARSEIDRDSELPSSWKQPNLLDAPPPRAGMTNRWVRFRAENAEDAEHFEAMLDEGWRAVKRASVRRVHELTSTTHGKYGGYYVKRGLILMELPTELAVQRKRYYHKQLADQNRGVDKSLFKLNRTGGSVMPMLHAERRSSHSTTARRGRLEEAVPGDEPA